MKSLFTLFNFFIKAKQNPIDDIKPLTEFLKTNKHFTKSSLKIHHTKENFKKSFLDLLDAEDNVKYIEDKSNNGKQNKY